MTGSSLPGNEVHRQVVLVQLYEADCALADLLHYFGRQQLLDGLHEGGLAVAALGGALGCAVVEALGHGVRRHHLLHVVAELAEELVVEADRPVLTEELHDVRDKAVVVPLADVVEVLIGKADEAGKRRHCYVFAAEIADILDDSVRIDGELDVVSLEVLDILADQLLAAHSLLQHCLGQRVVRSLDVVVDHVSEERASHSHRHVQPWKLLVRVLLSRQIAQIEHLQHLFAEDGTEFSAVVAIEAQTAAN